MMRLGTREGSLETNDEKKTLKNRLEFVVVLRFFFMATLLEFGSGSREGGVLLMGKALKKSNK